MKFRAVRLWGVAVVLLLLLPLTVLAQSPAGDGAAFSYQGQMFDSAGQPVYATCDLTAKIYDSADSQIELDSLQVDKVKVTDGLFSVIIDFGGDVFDGSPRWLETWVVCETGQTPDSLGRHEIYSTPYATYAYAVDWSNVKNRPDYTAGAGLALVGTEFSLPSAFRLPQECEAGETAQWDEDYGVWLCATVEAVTDVYTTTEVDVALALKLDAADHTWTLLAGVPAGFADGIDNVDDTVSWSEISGIVSTGATSVAQGDHDHDGDYYTRSQVDTALALKLDVADAYTTAEIDDQLATLQANIDAKVDATEVYTQSQVDDALALKLDVADHTWTLLAGVPAGFADGIDNVDDTVSWSEISGMVGTGATNVAAGDHDHDGDYYTHSQVDDALALKLDVADAYTTAQVDSQLETLEADLALKIDATGVYTTAEIDSQLATLQTDIDAKVDATEVYTTAEIDAALALKLDAADFAWSGLVGVPAGFADGIDNVDDTVSWPEISEIVGTGATNVAAGDHNHDGDYYTRSQVDTALALKLDVADAYTAGQVDSQLATLQADIDAKVDATDVYTTAEIDSQLEALDAGLALKVDATDVYTTAEIDAAVALKLDTADFVWSGLAGVPAGLADGIDNVDDTVSWSEISEIVGTGATNVAAGDHDHDGDYYTHSQVDGALALKLDAADFVWSGLGGVPAGFADGIDNVDDTVSWSEISGIAGTGASNVAVGNHTHTYAAATNGASIYLGYKPNNVACASNQVLKWDATNSRWLCGTDNDAGGDITGVTAGSGLTGGGASGAVTVNVNFAGTGSAATVARSDHTHPDSEGWSLSGNSISSGNFVGTTNDQPLILKTNNQTGLQLKSYADYFTPPSVIGGWAGNYASNGGVIAGGGMPDFSGNAATGLVSFVGAGSSNSATGSHSVVSGGSGNLADQQYAVVSGGYNGNAIGQYSVVPGGSNNSAGGDYSFAAGNNASANYQGAFVWSDSVAPTSADALNSVTFGASGGYRLFTNSARTSGARLAAGGGSWASMSDRNMKENLSAVDTQAVLEQVGELPLSTWNYLSQAEDIRHIGPMAQDFYAAFGVGENDTTITAIDGDGVSLAAIQALYERVLALEAENETLKNRLNALELHSEGQ